jgi:hypothetical protein
MWLACSLLGGTHSCSLRGNGNEIMETGIVDTRYSVAHRAVVRCVVSLTVLRLSAQADVILRPQVQSLSSPSHIPTTATLCPA